LWKVSVCTHVGVQAFAGTIDPSRVKFTVSCTATTESVLPAFALLVSCDPALLRLLVAHRQRWERTHGRPPRKSRARSFPRGHGRDQGKIIHRVASPRLASVSSPPAPWSCWRDPRRPRGPPPTPHSISLAGVFPRHCGFAALRAAAAAIFLTFKLRRPLLLFSDGLRLSEKAWKSFRAPTTCSRLCRFKLIL
jgi:hypothetical protein